MRAVDLFAGWGGLTFGAEMAGVSVLWAGNHSPEAVETHQMNHPKTRHEVQDLRQADRAALLRVMGQPVRVVGATAYDARRHRWDSR